jgi:LemA protein
MSLLAPFLILFAIIIVILLWWWGTYNRLVTLNEQVSNAWAQIDVQLRRRYDLIPNIVETVKGYAAHESGTLEAVTKARQQAVDLQNGTPEQRQQAENMLTSTLRTLFAVSEAYPNLKANENFMMLQEELSGTEGKIAYARQHFNDSVNVFNATIKMFPANMIAGASGFTAKTYFQTEDDTKEAPKVKF